MNEFIQNMTGMGAMTEQVIATDFLISAKTGVKNIATAITETSSPEVRETLKQYLNDAIDTHEQITNYMISKGFTILRIYLNKFRLIPKLPKRLKIFRNCNKDV